MLYNCTEENHPMVSWDCESSLKYRCGPTTSSQWSIHFQSSGRCITETVYYNIDDSLKVYIRFLTLLIYRSTVWWPINYSLAHSDRALLFSFSNGNITANYRWPCIFIGRLRLHHKRHSMSSGKFWISNLLPSSPTNWSSFLSVVNFISVTLLTSLNWNCGADGSDLQPKIQSVLLVMCQ